LITGSVIGTVAVFTLSGAAIYRGARSTLVRQLDDSLDDQARVIASVVKYTPDGIEVEVEDIDVPEYTSPRVVAAWRSGSTATVCSTARRGSRTAIWRSRRRRN
jgi:hypothetical protein